MLKVKCKRCYCYHAFYRMGIGTFWYEEEGLCDRQDKIVKEDEGCEFYQPPVQDIQAIIDLLTNTIEEINKIKKIYDIE